MSAWNGIAQDKRAERKRGFHVPLGSIAVASLLAIAGISGGSTTALAQNGGAFYKGRQVTFIIGGSVGGGYDTYSRTVGRHMRMHLPGDPNFVMKNMHGGGGKIAANYLYNIAPKDGSAFGMVGRAMGIRKLVAPKDKAAKFDALKFNWIGSPQTEVGLVMVRGSSKIKEFQDLQSHTLVVSATGRAAPPSFYPMMLNRFFGAKFQIIRGYKGSQATLLAMEKGEAQGTVTGSASAVIRKRIAPWIESGKVKVMLLIGTHGDPEFKGVPTVLDVAKTAKQRAILKVILTQQVMAWPLVAPPQVPSARVKALRDAFDATMTDPSFLKDAHRQELGLDPVSGKEIEDLLKQVYASSPETLHDVASLLAKKKK